MRNIRELALLRSNTYKLLASCLYYPEKEFIEDLMDGSILHSLKESNSGFDEGMKNIEDFVKGYKDAEALYTELAAEYVRLFVTSKQAFCQPYESYYSGSNILMTEAPEVMKAYSKAGLKISSGFKDLPDHIATELEFMHYLCFKQAESLSKKDEKNTEVYSVLQKNFLNEHLVKWTPDLCKCIIKESKIGFYKGVAQILGNFINFEKSNYQS